jgi:acetylornithine deacetylase/succinyl-diaminopimelate desuccinylase-like protein
MSLLEDYLELLEPFIGFRSVSTDPSFAEALKQTADWLGGMFERHGFRVEHWAAAGLNPVVYARYAVEATAPTVLVYGHYDVQPAARSDGWQTDPFKLRRRQERLYGRGVVDNKGQVLIHIATVLELIAAGRLAYNVIFLIEGNEETGSTGLATLLRQHKTDLSCDHVLVSDGEIPYRPAIEASLRGGFNVKLRYTTASNNLHSGIYGGGVPNAAQELSRLLGSLYDDHYRVTIPGFYDDVESVSAKQQAAAKALYVGDKRLQEVTGVKRPLTEPGYEFGAAVGLRPTLQVTGLKAGYIGEGFANIVPASAEAWINVRLTAHQKTAAVYRLIEEAVATRTPEYVSWEMDQDMANEPIQLATDTPLVHHTQRLLQEAYGVETVFLHSGGSIPIVQELRELLETDPLLVALGNDDCNMHGVDENFDLDLLKKGLDFSQRFFSQPLK